MTGQTDYTEFNGEVVAVTLINGLVYVGKFYDLGCVLVYLEYDPAAVLLGSGIAEGKRLAILKTAIAAVYYNIDKAPKIEGELQ